MITNWAFFIPKTLQQDPAYIWADKQTRCFEEGTGSKGSQSNVTQLHKIVLGF